MKESRRNAHVRPIAQYTEVTISGTNSSAPPELLVLESSGSASGQMKPSLGVHATVAFDADEDSCCVLGTAAMRGKTVTKRWRAQNPAR